MLLKRDYLLFFLIIFLCSCQSGFQTKPDFTLKSKKTDATRNIQLDQSFLEAVKTKKLSLAQQYLNQGAFINYQEELDGFSALHYVAYAGYLAGVQWLVEHKADLSLASKEGMTALHFACREGHLDIVKVLLLNQADFKARDYKSGWNCLDFAVFWGQLEICQLLLEYKMLVNEPDSDGSVPLHKAVLKSDLKITKFLLDKGANPNLKNKEGFTPMMLANNLEIRQILKR